MTESHDKLLRYDGKFVLIKKRNHHANKQPSIKFADDLKSLAKLVGFRGITKESFKLDDEETKYQEMTQQEQKRFYYFHKRLLEKRINDKVIEAKYKLIKDLETLGKVRGFSVSFEVEFEEVTSICLYGQIELEI